MALRTLERSETGDWIKVEKRLIRQTNTVCFDYKIDYKEDSECFSELFKSFNIQKKQTAKRASDDPLAVGIQLNEEEQKVVMKACVVILRNPEYSSQFIQEYAASLAESLLKWGCLSGYPIKFFDFGSFESLISSARNVLEEAWNAKAEERRMKERIDALLLPMLNYVNDETKEAIQWALRKVGGGKS